MLSITRFAVGNQRLTLSVLVLVVLAGLQLFLVFPRQEDPPIVIREAVVSVAFPGMTPDRMEDLITRRVEAEIRTMPEIDEITSDTKAGLATIHATTRDDYDDLDAIWQRLRNKMSDLSRGLPEGTVGPFVNDAFGLTAVATIAVWSDGFSMAENRIVARDIRDRLYELQGVRKVELYGVLEEQVFLKFSNARLAQFGFSVSEIVRSLLDQNVILPGGTVEASKQRILVSPSGNYRSVEEIRETLIALPEGDQMVRLSDLMEVERAYADPPSSLAFFNGKEAIVISVSIVPGVNAVEFGQHLTRKIRELESQLPIGFVLEYATFQPDLVEAAVNGALTSVYQTLGIVFAVVVLFLGLRSGTIVGSFIPLTMLLGLIIMSLFAIELERVSIISAIVALGMLVDNAIVVVEDIKSRFEAGQERREACIEAGETLALPLLTSSLTTILAFMPMLLIKGSTGEYIFSLPMVVTILLLGSWFLCLFSTPMLCYWFMKVKPADKESSDEPTRQSGGLVRAYRGLLEMAMRTRLLVLGLTIALLGLAVFGGSNLVKEFFGPSDRNQFLVYIDLPSNARLEATQEAVRDFTSWASDPEANPEVESTIAYVGTGGPRFFLSLSPVDPSPNVAFVIVNTKDAEGAVAASRRARQHLLANFPDVNARVKRMWLGANEPAYLEYRVVGPDLETIYRLAKRIEDGFWALEGIDYVQNDWGQMTPIVEVQVDQTRARRAGVTSEEVARSLNAFLSGTKLTEYREGDLAIPVVIQSDDSERDTLGDLWNISVYSASRGLNVPLTQIADFRGRWQFNLIARKDQERTVTVSAKHQVLKAPELADAMRPVLSELDLPPGYRVEIGGELEDSAEANEKLFGNMPLAMFLILLLLIWQFNSFRRPAIIALSIPMAFAGAIVGLLALGAPFDFFGILGFLSLAGVIINNGIVLIDRIDGLRKLGAEPYSAVVEATLSRARPILISATTTILGVLPLIIIRDPLFYSMAVIIAFGLALGTVLTLIVVPVLYSLLFRVRPAKQSSFGSINEA